MSNQRSQNKIKKENVLYKVINPEIYCLTCDFIKPMQNTVVIGLTLNTLLIIKITNEKMYTNHTHFLVLKILLKMSKTAVQCACNSS